MTEPAQPQPEPQAGPPAQQPTTAPSPPWGSPEEFNPERAWSLIQNKNADLEKAKARIAELSPFEAKARELEEAQKSELQRAQEAAATAAKEAETARGELLRLKVATAKGLSAELAGRLRGATEEELSADADALLAAFPQPQPVAALAANGHTPVEALRPGALPNPPAPSLDDRIAEAQRKGEFRTVIALQNQKLDNRT